MMSTTEPLVLPADVLLIPLENLPDTLRGETEYEAGDCALVGPSSDIAPSVVNAATAALLKEFRVPQTADDALRRFCQANDVDAAAMHDEVVALLQDLMEAGLVVSGTADEEQARQAAGAAEQLLAEVLERVSSSGPLLAAAIGNPSEIALDSGASGIAYALWRIARVRDDPALLALADRWAAKAEAACADKQPSESPPSAAGASLHHGPAGVHAVRALIRHALGDQSATARAITSFLAASRPLPDGLDLMDQRSGTLLACAHLLKAATTDGAETAAPVQALGEQIARGLWATLNAFEPIAQCAAFPSLGVAHGWGGVLYATLRWAQATGTSPPAGLPARLAQLAACAEYVGRGARWEWKSLTPGPNWLINSTPGWCNGSAGFVHLWTLAYRTLQREAYLDLATKAAWNAWEERWTSATLCCGLAGQAYALLALYNVTGSADWLQRARTLADLAAVRVAAATDEDHALRSLDGVIRDSFYRGEIGVALLAAELARPELARMPFFEAD
jgi:hypothetical protein